MVFDGDCGFCAMWIKRWQEVTGDRVDYRPYQDAEVTAQFPELAQAHFAAAVHFIEPQGNVSSGARAVFGALATDPAQRWPLRAYELFPVFARVADGCYRFVADHRPGFSKLTRLAWGRHFERPTHHLDTPLKALGGLC
jgi:predicted DCC family thiol-disulfide oxidoreductase YuxK